MSTSNLMEEKIHKKAPLHGKTRSKVYVCVMPSEQHATPAHSRIGMGLGEACRFLLMVWA